MPEFRQRKRKLYEFAKNHTKKLTLLGLLDDLFTHTRLNLDSIFTLILVTN